MENNNFKNDFYRRIYKYSLSIIKFVEKLPKDSVSQIMGK